MAAIDFPANPIDGDTCVRAGKTWTYSSSKLRWSAEAAAGGGTWGSITGTLSAQTDLQSALNAKSALAGSTSITTLGTITTGTWNGTAISDSYISSAATWNAKQAALVSGTNIKTVGSQSILGSGDLSVATIGAAAASHTHVSADITDATDAATANTVVKRGSSGGASFASNSAPTTALSASNTAGGRGATATSSGSGSGAYGSSSMGAGLEGYSSTGVGILATSNSGTNHAEFGDTSDNRSFVQRVSGLFGWWRGAFKQTLGAATTLTANRAVLLPDADGTLLISSLNLSGLSSPPTALTNLGATTIGSNIFTAVDAAAVNTLLGIQSKTGTSTGLSAVGTTDITGLTGFTLDASTWYKLELHYLWTSTSSNFQINFVTTGTFERGGTTPALGQAMSSVSALATAIFVGNTSFQMRGSVAENRTNVPMVGWAYFKTGTSGTGKVQLELLAGTTLSTITSSKAVLTKM